MEYKDQNWSINLVPFLIRFYGFDLHCYYSGTIISTKTIIYEYYFNYYLNGYTLEHESSLIRDEKTGLFTYQDTPIELIKENQAFKEEADLILKRTPREEIPNFYR